MLKTYCTKLIIDDDERKRLIETLEVYKNCTNFCSEFIFNTRINSIVTIHKHCYRTLRNLYPNAQSQIVIRAENAARAQYRAIKSRKDNILKPAMTKVLSMRLDKRLYSFKDRSIRISAIGGKRIEARLVMFSRLEEMFSKFTPCDPAIFEKNGFIWISITFNTPKPVVTENFAIGVDLGINRLASTSEGIIINTRSFNARKRALRYLRRSLKSKRTKSAKRHLRSIQHKERNMTRNAVHIITNELLRTNANILVLENLTNIKRRKQNKYKTQFNNKQSQIPYYLIKEILTYKAQALGKRVVTVKPYFTSQDDFRGLPRGERKGCRYYAHDKVVLDADLNAANNIALKSKLPVSCCKALDGQATVSKPIVYKFRQRVSQETVSRTLQA